MAPIFGKVFDTQKWMKYGTWLASGVALILVGIIIVAIINAHQRAARITAGNIAIIQGLSTDLIITHVVPKVPLIDSDKPAPNGSTNKPTSPATLIAATSKVSAQIPTTQAALRPMLITVRTKDTLPRIFKRLGYKPSAARKMMVLNSDASKLANLREGQKILFMFSSDRRMRQLTYSPDMLTTLTINCGKFCHASVKHNIPKERLEYVSGYLAGSIYSSGKKIGLNHKIISQLAAAFRTQLNLSHLQKGDKIALFYKSYYVNGKKYRDGDLAAAVVTHKKQSYKVIAFTDPHDRTDFYLANGMGLIPPFMRYPVQFKRISSGFSLRRWHPILHFTRPHYGVDFAANYGTPVHATSDGRIVFAGFKSGLGKALDLQHNQYRTVYGHLSRIANNIHAGSYVKKGQIIAYVGSTGLSDGPHLHYEFRINNVAYDPLRVKLPSGEMIASCYRKQFFALSRTLFAQLDMHSQHIAMLN